MCDISMCLNKSCPMKSKCVRYRAVPSDIRQSYGSFKYDSDGCPNFWDVKNSPYKLREVVDG